jgi:hypothetical protein
MDLSQFTQGLSAGVLVPFIVWAAKKIYDTAWFSKNVIQAIKDKSGTAANIAGLQTKKNLLDKIPDADLRAKTTADLKDTGTNISNDWNLGLDGTKI